MKPIFCRVGSKRPLRNIIPRYFPKDFKKYVEPFVGGGAIFFYNDFSDKKVVLNDLDKNLMNNYKKIKRGLTGDITKYNSTDLNYLKNIYAKTGGTDLDRFVRYLLGSCNTFGSIGEGDLYKASNPYMKLKNLDKYQAKLAGASLLSKDYKQVIRNNDGVDTLFYLDPPYEDSEGLYDKDNIKLEDLSNLLKGIKGKFLLSINDSPSTRQVFSPFKITKIKVQGGAHHEEASVGGKIRKELLVRNY